MVAASWLLSTCMIFQARQFLCRIPYRKYRSSSKGQRNMLMYLQIIGTGSSEVSPSIFLFTESNRYMFNCSESVQTVCYEHGVKFSRLRNVFVTRMNWENIGGLPGLLMSLRDHTSPGSMKEATIHGPLSLHNFKSIASSTFLNQESLTMNINTIPLDRDSSTSLVYNADDLSVKGYEVFINNDDEDRIRRMIRLNEDGSPDPKRPCLQRNHDGSVVFYVCQLSKTVGKFHPDKAQELGVPRGALYRKLVSGNAVVTPAGRTVFPLEVMDPDEPGPCFIVIECPSVSFIPHLVGHPQLQTGTANPNIIIHIAPRQVLEHELYREWFESFGDKIQNVFVHREVCRPEIVMRSCYKLQVPLNLIDSDIFHIQTVPYSKHTSIAHSDRPSCIPATTLMKLYLKPKSKYGIVEDHLLPPLKDSVDEYVTELKTNTELLSKVSKCSPDIHQRITSVSTASVIAGPTSILPTESSVTFLGTASTVPSKYRSHSAILLHLPSSSPSSEPGFMFLDCGEGTLGQLYKCYGEGVADRVLSNLKCVFVSHIHGDHHLGLIRLMQRRYHLLQQQHQSIASSSSGRCSTPPLSVPPLLIIGPNSLRRWLEEYRRSCEHLSFWFENSKAYVDQSLTGAMPDGTTTSSSGRGPPTLHQSLQELGFTSLSTVNVIHVQQSYGVVLVHKEGWKLVYSGDTRPCNGLVDAAGKGTTLLIHEATFDDSLQLEAISKKHSTMAEALGISAAMDAKFTILTHFSQRYPKFSTTFMSKSMQQNMAFAFDFMTIPIMRENQKLKEVQPLIHDVFRMLNFESDD